MSQASTCDGGEEKVARAGLNFTLVRISANPMSARPVNRRKLASASTSQPYQIIY